MPIPKTVKIVEVGPRDGLQNELTPIPTQLKIDFIDALSKSGLRQIETTSYVSPKWIPQLADHHEVSLGIQKNPNVRYVSLTPNLQGFENALKDGLKEVAVFTAASNTFSKKNTNSNIEDSLTEIGAITDAAKHHNIPVRAYISCVIACPYEGKTPADTVATLTEQLIQMGCHEISLGDTIGVGNPHAVTELIQTVSKKTAIEQLAVHFHDTYGQALVNIYAALSLGVNIIDSSAAGLGGCPYAPGAGGNIATEDILYLCEGLGIETGVDMERLSLAGKLITNHLGIEPRSKAAIAIQASQAAR